MFFQWLHPEGCRQGLEIGAWSSHMKGYFFGKLYATINRLKISLSSYRWSVMWGKWLATSHKRPFEMASKTAMLPPEGIHPCSEICPEQLEILGFKYFLLIQGWEMHWITDAVLEVVARCLSRAGNPGCAPTWLLHTHCMSLVIWEPVEFPSYG